MKKRLSIFAGHLPEKTLNNFKRDAEEYSYIEEQIKAKNILSK